MKKIYLSIAGFMLMLSLLQLSFAATINAPLAQPSETVTARSVLRASQTAETTANPQGKFEAMTEMSGIARFQPLTLGPIK